MADIDLKIEGLKKHFGGVRAVDGISFNVHEGEILALLGRLWRQTSGYVADIGSTARTDDGAAHEIRLAVSSA